MSAPGDRIGSYELVRVIALGGMATVYEARQPALDRAVALKRLDLRTNDTTLAARFIVESRIAASFDHPNIVTVFDFFEWDGVPYIAMEYLPRGSLRPWMAHLILPQAFGVLEGVLAALAHAEQHGVAHRDLKPENVLVTRRGAVKIADFGIAKAYTATTGGFTQTGIAVGTPAYMAPEQALGHSVGPYTDLYAVGVMAFEMLSGAPPFGGSDTPMAIMYRHVNEVPPRLEGVDPRLADWVGRLLEKAPGDRPAGAAEAWQALEEIVVDLLGPYWRRHSPLEEGWGAPEGGAPSDPPAVAAEPPTTVAPQATPPPDRGGTAVTRVGGLDEPGAAGAPAATRIGGAHASGARGAGARTASSAPRRRRALAAVAALALLGTGTVVALALDDSPSREGAERTPARAPVLPGRAYDFDADGTRSVVAGLPGWRPLEDTAGRGGVALPGASRLVTAADAGAPRGRTALDGFGSAVASGDFDSDGRADLAVATPGADIGDAARREGSVAVLHAARDGRLGRRSTPLLGTSAPAPYRDARFGTALAAGDLDGDRYADLAIGAPGSAALPAEDRGSGAVVLVFGGPQGLGARRRVIRRPRSSDAAFGSVLRLGDLDGDERIDLLAAAPGNPVRGVPGHVAYCPGTPRGPVSCRPVGGVSGATALGVGDVDGDGAIDLIAGVPSADGGAGAVALWRGTPSGPALEPQLISQDSPEVVGNGQPGDAFGQALAVARLDPDRFAEIVVGAPGENGGAGRVTLLRGGPEGYAPSRRSYALTTPGVPGDEADGDGFGSALAVFDTVGDAGRDLVVAVPGTRRLVTLHGRGGSFTGEGATSLDLAGLSSAGTLPAGAPVRLGRPDG